MPWGEDQCGIGELMRLEPEDWRHPSCGYASFVRDYDALTRRRLEDYARQALSSGASW
jgi:hypothetical protein